MPVNPNDNNLPQGVKYEDVISDPESLRRKSPCQNHALEAEDERELELPEKCIKQENYSTCPNKNICEQCKID